MHVRLSFLSVAEAFFAKAFNNDSHGTIMFSYFSDINECVESPEICGVGNKCQNVYAGHECVCSDAYALSDDRKSCIGKNYVRNALQPEKIE